MMKHELDNLIAPAVSTWDEYDRIDQIYMNADITKEEAAKIWGAFYKEAWKKRTAKPTLDEVVRSFNDVHEKFSGNTVWWINVNGYNFRFEFQRSLGNVYYVGRMIKDFDVKHGKTIYSDDVAYVIDNYGEGRMDFAGAYFQ